MTRNRKVLLAVDRNILSGPPIRRIQSDSSEFSMESWKERALADSKTPKISNCGGSATKKSATKRRTHHRPPRPTRRKCGSLGSSILASVQPTPQKPQAVAPRPRPTNTTDFMAHRSEPTAMGADVNLAQNVDSLRLKSTDTNKLSMVGLQERLSRNAPSQSMDEVGPKNTKVALSRPSVTTRKHKDNAVGASSRNFMLPMARLETSEKEEMCVRNSTLTTNGSDEDMNCDSSENSLLNSSTSSSERGFSSKSSLSKENDEIRASSAFAEASRKIVEVGSDEAGEGNDGATVGNQNFRSSGVAGEYQAGNTIRRDASPGSNGSKNIGLLGATVGNDRFAKQNLEEDTDVTDMTSLSYGEGNATSPSADSEDNSARFTPKECSQIGVRGPGNDETSDKHCIHGQEVGRGNGQSTARRLTFCKVEKEGPRSAKNSPEVEESIEAWSIEGYRNSPIEIRIEGKKYIHPPLPAGWRIKISKTHQRPIYIHPDIGRTFHCPVDLPRNVTYVRMKDGKLQKQLEKKAAKITSNSPRAIKTSDTPPSATQDTPTSQTDYCKESAKKSANSDLDSTSRLIRGAAKLSATCVHNSSRNLKFAKALLRNAKESPSTLSDVVHFYQQEKTASLWHKQSKNGYDCDVSDSEQSWESNSSLSSLGLMQNLSHKQRAESSVAPEKAMSPVLETQEEFDGLLSESLGRMPILDNQIDCEDLGLDKGTQADQTQERFFTPAAPENDKEILYAREGEETLSTDNEAQAQDSRRPNATVETTNQQKAPDSDNDSAHNFGAGGEFIDGWFTPNVPQANARENNIVYEEVAVLRHSAKREIGIRARSPLVEKIRDISTQKVGSHCEKISCQDNRMSSVERSPDLQDIEAPKESTTPNISKMFSGAKDEKSEPNNALLPFFDIFEKHLAGDGETNSSLDKVEAKESGPRPESAINLPDWQSPNVSGIESSSPQGKTEFRTPIEIKLNAMSTPRPRVDGGSSACAITSKEDNQSSQRKQSQACAQNNQRDAGAAKIVFSVASSVTKTKQCDYTSPIHTDFEATAASSEAIRSHRNELDGGNNRDSIEHSRTSSPDSAIDFLGCNDDNSADFTRNSSPRQNDQKPFKGPKIMDQHADGSPAPESTPRNDSGFETSVNSQDSPEVHVDEKKGNKESLELVPIGLQLPDTVKRRRMSWRVTNPKYPLCSLQRLDEIALQRRKRKSLSTQKRKRHAKIRPKGQETE